MKEYNQLVEKIPPRYFRCWEYLGKIFFATLKIKKEGNDKEEKEIETNEEEEE
jgi:hypothetical protein